MSEQIHLSWFGLMVLSAAGMALLGLGFGVYVLLAGRNAKMPVKQAASLGLSLVWILPVLAVTSVVVAVVGPHLFDPVHVDEETVVASNSPWLRAVRAQREHGRLAARAIADSEPTALLDSDTAPPQAVADVSDAAQTEGRGAFRIQTPDGEVVFETSKEAVRVKLGDWKWNYVHPEKRDTEIVEAELQTDELPAAASTQPPVDASQPVASGEPVVETSAAPSPAQTVDTESLASDVGLLRPQWMDQAGAAEGGAAHVVIEGSPKVTPEEAIASALAKAAEMLKAELAKVYGEHGAWTLPIEDVRDYAAFDFYVEPYKVITAGEPQGINTNRAFVLINLTPQVRHQVYLTWREQIVERRLWAFGGLFGLATLIVATGAGYLRLDTLSHGAYRRRLKLAAVSLIVAGGLALAATLPQV